MFFAIELGVYYSTISYIGITVEGYCDSSGGLYTNFVAEALTRRTFSIEIVRLPDDIKVT